MFRLVFDIASLALPESYRNLLIDFNLTSPSQTQSQTNPAYIHFNDSTQNDTPDETSRFDSQLIASSSSSNQITSLTIQPAYQLSPRATQDLISRLDATPPILPQNIANIITVATIAARLGLRSTSFFAELVVESIRYSTNTTVGLTRRALTSAVGGARSNHLTSPDHFLELTENDMELTYFQLLDRYTNLGIYTVHHIFTLTELFAMAGLNLTQSAISTGFGTAEASVKVMDSIFGSNESSRALSAIIMLVRREFLHDPRFTPSHINTLTGLISLTKAMTAFACLQLATSRRSMANMKMRVVWDATVMDEAEVETKIFGNGTIDYDLGTRAAEVLIREAKALREERAQSAASQNKLDSVPSSAAQESTHNPTKDQHQNYSITELQTTSASGNTWHNDQGVTSATRWSISRSNSHTSVPILTCTGSDGKNQFGGHDTSDSGLDEDINRTLLNTPHSWTDSEQHAIVPSSYEQIPVNQLVEPNEHQGDSPLYQITTTITTTTATTVRPVNDMHSKVNPSSGYERLQAFHSCQRPFEKTMDGYFECIPHQTLTDAIATAPSRSYHHSQEEEWIEFSSQEFEGVTTGVDHLAMNSFNQNSCSNCEPNASRLGLRAPPSTPNLERPKTLGILMRTMSSRRRTRYHASASCDFDNVGLGFESLPTIQFEECPTSRSLPNSLPTSPRQPFLHSFSSITRNAIHSRSRTYSGTMPVLAESETGSQSAPPSSDEICQVPDQVIQSSSSPTITPPPVPLSITITDPTEGNQHQTDEKHWSKTPSTFAIEAPLKTDAQSTNNHPITQAFSPNPKPPQSCYPPNSLVTNLSYFMKFSSAAYGQQFLRVMGLGSDSFNYPNTRKHSGNHHAFASHVGLPVDQILYSSFADSQPTLGNSVLSPLVHYIAVDHSVKSIVLTCRGTLGLSDILVDLTCQYEPILVEGGDPEKAYLAHSGMLHSALRLRHQSSLVHQELRQALLDHPDYGLIITGHSLGGGVASLLAVLFSTRSEVYLNELSLEEEEPPRRREPRIPITTKFVTSFKSGLPPGRPIHCYCYGPPAVSSIDLSEYLLGLVTSVCNGIDVVPTLSLGVLHDFKNVAVSIYDEEKISGEIVSKVIGLYSKRSPKNNDTQDQKDEDFPELSDWFWSLKSTMKAASDSEKLYPPGEVWHVEKYEVYPNIKEEEELKKKEAEVKAETEELKKTEEGSGVMMPHEEKKACTMTNANPNPSGMITVAKSWLNFGKLEAQLKKINGISGSSSSSKSKKRGGKRVVLRRCDDLVARFSEPIFGKTMFHDHLPTQYEIALGVLEEAINPKLKKKKT